MSKRFLITFGILSLFALYFTMLHLVPGNIVSAASYLVSQGKPASAGTSGSGTSAAAGNDGDITTTRWGASSGSFPQWWKVDLGSGYNLNRVDIKWYYKTTPRAYKYKIESSSDDATYATVVDKTNNSINGDTSDSFTATGRYVRVTVTGCNDGTAWASFWGCQVYSPDAPTPTPTPTMTPTPTPTPTPVSGTINYECEDLTQSSLPPNQEVTNPDPVASGGAWSKFTATSAGFWVEYAVNVPNAGTFNVKVTSKYYDSRGIYQLYIDGEAQGTPVDLYAASGSANYEKYIANDLGNATFLTPGNKIFRFKVTGKNSGSSAYTLSFDKIVLTSVTGFTLLSPNDSYSGSSQPVLRWNPVSNIDHYAVYIDDSFAANVVSGITSYQTAGLGNGKHTWYVLAVDAGNNSTKSNKFSFVAGSALNYPYREYSDNFESGSISNYVVSGMSITTSALSGSKSLGCTGAANAYVKDVLLEKKEEGEVSALIALDSGTSKAGVGFRAEDGISVYAVADAEHGKIRIERKVQGYSILDPVVTPTQYQIAGWAERTEGSYYVWEVESKAFTFTAGSKYLIKLAFSRRSMCAMATLANADGSSPVVVRDIVDLRTMDHPLLVSVDGPARFDDFAYKKLNKDVYKWDPDAAQIVLGPGATGSWDSKGAFNPAIVIKDGTWYMFYRGNSTPAPPNGSPSSELGLATSSDGIHWTKYAANPVIAKHNGSDSNEDPDLIIPAGGNTIYLEYRDLYPTNGEVMCSSTDFINWSAPWEIKPTGSANGMKIGGIIDTHNSPAIPEINYQGTNYRYVSVIEEGTIALTNDLHSWIYAGTADFAGHSDKWCNFHECGGDIFVDADGNIRAENQAGTEGVIVGNRECTNMEEVLTGTQPWTVLHHADLPYLPDWYGNAPTGDSNEFTAWNGSTFPGQTIVKDGYLWHYGGINNTFTGLIKCYYGQLFEYRDLTLSNFRPAPNQNITVTVTVRNVGSLRGTENVTLKVNGSVVDSKNVTIDRDQESAVTFTLAKPAGTYTVDVGGAAATMVVQ
jgi:hypothetical protein